MTSAVDFMTPDRPIKEDVVSTDGGRLILRILQRLVGVSLALAAAALWIAPGSSMEGDVMLYKLILSLTSVIAGMGLMHASARPPEPEIEIDTIRREVRLVRRTKSGEDTVLSASTYAELGKVEVDGPYVRLWDAKMTLLAEVTLYDRDTRLGFLGALRDEGKLD
jgi:hypothetical protein